MKTLSTQNKLNAYVLFLFSILLTSNALAQSDSTIIKSDRSGKGNGTFHVSVTGLESVINRHLTYKELESQLGNWQSFGNLNEIYGGYDENTKGFTIPLYEIYYESATKNRYYSVKAEVSKALKNAIKELHITLEWNGDQLAQFKRSLTANGYWLNENLTATFRKLAYKNKSDDLITIHYNANGSYTIGIIK